MEDSVLEQMIQPEGTVSHAEPTLEEVLFPKDCSLCRATKLSYWEGGVRERLGGRLAASHSQPTTAGKDSLVLLCPLSFSMVKLLLCTSRRNQIGKYK